MLLAGRQLLLSQLFCCALPGHSFLLFSALPLRAVSALPGVCCAPLLFQVLTVLFLALTLILHQPFLFALPALLLRQPPLRLGLLHACHLAHCIHLRLGHCLGRFSAPRSHSMQRTRTLGDAPLRWRRHELVHAHAESLSALHQLCTQLWHPSTHERLGGRFASVCEEVHLSQERDGVRVAERPGAAGWFHHVLQHRYATSLDKIERWPTQL